MNRSVLRRPVLALLWAACVIAGASNHAAAQSSTPAASQSGASSWPTKSIRAIVPLAPGTGGDVISRIALNQLSIELGHPVVIENKGGAGGTIGVAQVAKADPDGYTLLAHSSSHVIAPALYPNLPYDIVQDLAAVIPLGNVASALVTSPSSGIKTVQDLVARAKAHPNTLTYASAGIGSSTHLTAERFLISAGIKAVHVPFRGGGFQPEIMAGRIDFAYSPIATSLPNILGGNLLPLAVSGSRRVPALPDVPTTLELGFSNSDYVLWMGLFVPAKTPRDIVQRLHDKTQKALESAAVRERFVQLDVQPMPMSPVEFDALIKTEIVANAALAKAAGLKPN